MSMVEKAFADSRSSANLTPSKVLIRMITVVLLSVFGIIADAQSSRSGGEHPGVVVTERTRAELLAHAPDGIGPHKEVWLGFQLTHKAGWKSYWLNPGDAGLPTRLQWSLPPGVSTGATAWPVPSKFLLGF
jgi:thiol:disulfide interchange protein DsbD